MAEVICAICSKKTQSHYNGVKHCPKCNLWFCFDMPGQGANSVRNVGRILCNKVVN